MRLLLTSLSSLVLFAATHAIAAEADYPRGELLLEPSQLAKPTSADRFVILDVRSAEAFQKAHIPGAVHIDHASWKAAFDDGNDAAGWSKRIGQLGITRATPVVLYDDADMKNAARIWWLLRYWGVQDARLLNGGWHAWQAQDLPTTDKPTPPAKAVDFQAEAQEARLADKDQLLKLLGSGKLQIVDTRSFAEFCGTATGNNQRGGAIPNAKHLEWNELIDDKTHRFKPPAEISKLFEKAGIDPQRPVATHCQSGGRASVMVFGLELMGGNDVRNYYRGWSEWGNVKDTPIEKPQDKP